MVKTARSFYKESIPILLWSRGQEDSRCNLGRAVGHFESQCFLLWRFWWALVQPEAVAWSRCKRIMIQRRRRARTPLSLRHRARE